jgi:altronate dehydratase
MPTSTYKPIANLTVTSAVTSVAFSGITQAYRDIVCIISVKQTTSVSGLSLIFNSDTSSNYNRITMHTNGAGSYGSYSGTQTALNINYHGALTASGSNCIVNIMDYSATDKHKGVLCRLNAPGNEVVAQGYKWGSNSAITSIIVDSQGAQFDPGSVISLYGIVA